METKVLAALAVLFVGGPALGQYTARLPSTCTPDGTRCTQATSVVNPDGTPIGTGSGGGGGGGPATIADGADTAEGVRADAAYTDTAGTASGTVIGLNKGQFVQLYGIRTALPASLGQKTMANSLPVTLASDGTYATAANQTNGSQVAIIRGSATLATGQVNVGTTATLIRAADTGRTSITVIVGAANGCAFGNSGVTATTGYLLPATAGATDTTATAAALYGVCSAATTISYKAILP